MVEFLILISDYFIHNDKVHKEIIFFFISDM